MVISVGKIHLVGSNIATVQAKFYYKFPKVFMSFTGLKTFKVFCIFYLPAFYLFFILFLLLKYQITLLSVP